MLKLVVLLLGVSQIWAAVPMARQRKVPKMLIERLRHQPRIIGGAAAEDGSRPYIASLHISFWDFHMCGAGIISENVLISAAHCVQDEDPADYEMYVGSVYLSKGGTYYPIAEFIAHPGFDSSDLFDDISIIKLAKPLELSDKVQTISLPPKDLTIEGGEIVTAVGWGNTHLDPDESPNQLQWVDLGVVTNEDCSKAHSTEIGDGQICVGGEKGHGLCYGDSGSPLIYEKNGVTYTVGAVSWGSPCAVGSPDVFTRVSYYVDWIGENTK